MHFTYHMLVTSKRKMPAFSGSVWTLQCKDQSHYQTLCLFFDILNPSCTTAILIPDFSLIRTSRNKL